MRKKFKKSNHGMKGFPKIKLFHVALALASSTFVIITAPYALALGLASEQQISSTMSKSDAFKVLANQDSLNGSILGEAYLLAKQRLASAESSLKLKEQVSDAYENFINPDSLTTNSKCQAIIERSNDVLSSRKSDIYTKSDLLTMSSIGAFSNESDRQEALTDLKSQLTCTMEQAKAGYCTPNATGSQYYDVDFGLVNSSNRLSDNQFTAAKLGAMTIANPTKDSEVITQCNGDTACIRQSANQDSRIATSSLVINSLLTKAYNRVSMGSAYDDK